MTRTGSARAPQRAAGTCRNRRRRQATRRPEWVRPYRRAQRALDAALRMIVECLHAATVSEAKLERRPVRTARQLTSAARRLAAAGLRLMRASRELAEAKACLGRAPELAAGDASEIVELAAERWKRAVGYLGVVAGEVALRQVEVLSGLDCGALVPEKPSDSRPRIVVPRPVPVRAFLRLRQPRVLDRIASLLRRRRRTPRPAAIRVPRRTSQGRAPPLSSVCPL